MRLTIGTKILTGFLIVLCLMVMVAGFSVKQMSDMGEEAVSIENKWMPSVKTLAAMQSNMFGIQQSIFEMILETDDQKIVQAQSKMNDLIAELKTIQKKYHDVYTSNDNERKLYQQLVETEEQYLKSFPEVIQARKRNDFITANFLISQSLPQFNQAMSNLEQLIKLNDSGSNLATGRSIQTFKSGRLFVIIVSMLTVITSLGLAYFIARMISRPLIKVTAAAKEMAKGDLTIHNLTIDSTDEIGDLAKSFNEMVISLRELMFQVGINSELVAASSQQLTASADQTSSASERVAIHAQNVAMGAQHQVHDLGESKLIIDNMFESINQIVRRVQLATTAVSESAKLSHIGNEAIQTSKQQMDIIQSSVQRLYEIVNKLADNSNEVGKIISVITEIASKTNLLALNATIEAARAGEQGNGFAVVAYEVRKLAEQTGISAKQIANLVTNNQHETQSAKQFMEISAKEVSDGMYIIYEAGESFAQIHKAVGSIEIQTNEVSVSVLQLLNGAEQITRSIDNVANLAEQSAADTQNVSGVAEEQLASMEEIHASATSLADMASDLQNVISKFKV